MKPKNAHLLRTKNPALNGRLLWTLCAAQFELYPLYPIVYNKWVHGAHNANARYDTVNIGLSLSLPP